MARISIVTPLHLCRNPRVAKEADALGLAGHDVTIVGVSNHLESERLDQAILANACYERVLAIDKFSKSAWPLSRVFRTRLQTKIARTCVRRFRWQIASALGPVHELFGAAFSQPSDLTIAHTEVGLWVAMQLAAKGRRIAADFEDWYSEDLLPSDRASLPIPLLRGLERDAVSRCSYTCATSNSMAEAIYQRYGGARPLVITNSFPLQPDPFKNRKKGANDLPSFFWFSQTIGPGRGLELFLAAWILMTRQSRLVLLGTPQPGYRQTLLSRVPEPLRKLLEFLPLVSPEELPSLIARHDIGLALEETVIPNRNVTITNKILQYLNAGLAVVATDTAGQREVMSVAPEAGILISLQECAAVARALDQLVADRTALLACQKAARLAAERHYCWEHESPRLVAAVAKALQN